MWLTHGKKTHFHLSKNLLLNNVESKCHSFSGPPGLPNKSNKKLTNNDFNKPICSMGLEFLPTFVENLCFFIYSISMQHMGMTSTKIDLGSGINLQPTNCGRWFLGPGRGDRGTDGVVEVGVRVCWGGRFLLRNPKNKGIKRALES